MSGARCSHYCQLDSCAKRRAECRAKVQVEDQSLKQLWQYQWHDAINEAMAFPSTGRSTVYVPSRVQSQVPRQAGSQVPRQAGSQVPRQAGSQVPRQAVSQVPRQAHLQPSAGEAPCWSASSSHQEVVDEGDDDGAEEVDGDDEHAALRLVVADPRADILAPPGRLHACTE